MPLKKLLKIKNVHSKLFTKNSKCNPPYYTHNRTHSTIHITPYLLYCTVFISLSLKFYSWAIKVKSFPD